MQVETEDNINNKISRMTRRLDKARLTPEPGFNNIWLVFSILIGLLARVPFQNRAAAIDRYPLAMMTRGPPVIAFEADLQ
jgi:hypothetical protein